MRLHPSLMGLGLLLLQVGFAVADQTHKQAPTRRQQQVAQQPRDARGRFAAFPVDADMLKWVKANYPSIGDEEKQKQIARVLAEIKKDTGAWYEQVFVPYLSKLAMGGAHKILQFAGAARNPANIRSASSKFLQGALSEKNAAGEYVLGMPPGNPGLLNGFTRAPSARPAPPPTDKPGVPETGPGRPVGEGPQGPQAPGPGAPAGQEPAKDAAEREFAAMLEADENLRKAAAKRLAWFIWTQHANIDFIDKPLRDDAPVAAEFRTRTEGSLLPWVKRRAYFAALLIRFLGIPEADRPAGLAPKVIEHLKGATLNGQPRVQELAGQLIRWTRKSEEKTELEALDTGAAAIAGYPIGPLTKQEPVNWSFAFLKDAQGIAYTLLYGRRVEEARDDAEREGEDGVRVPGDGGVAGRDRLKLGPSFGFGDMYGGEGEGNDRYIFTVRRSDDPPNGGRRISMRIVTEEACAPDCSKQGADKRLVEKVGLYDISDSRELRGVTFGINALPAKPFSFKDGGRQFSLAYEEGRLVLKGDDKEGTTSTRGKNPSVDDLMRYRAEIAQKRGNIVKMGSREYYVWGQGVSDGGCNVYIPKDTADSVLSGGGKGDLLRADGMAVVNESLGGQDTIKGEEIFIRARNGKAFMADGEQISLRWNGSAFQTQKKIVTDPIKETATNGANAGDGNNAGGNQGGTAPSNGGTAPSNGGTAPSNGGTAERPNPPVQPGAHDAEGWPIIIDESNGEFPYLRNPSGPLSKTPHIDVKKLNAQLAANGVEAAIYQVRLDKARPPNLPKEIPATLDNMPPAMWFAVVFKNGDYGSLFYDESKPWKKIVDLKVHGSALSTENENSVVYVDLASGLVSDGQRRTFDLIGNYRDSQPSNNIAVTTKKPGKTGLEVAFDQMRRAGYPDDKIKEALGTITRVNRGMAADEKIGEDAVGVAIPANTEYKLSGGKKDMVLFMVVPIEGISTIKLLPKAGVTRGSPARVGDENLQGGQGTFAFDKPGAPIAWDGWGSPMDIGSDKGAVLLHRKTLEPVAGQADDAKQPGGRLYRVATKDDKGRGITRFYLAFTLENEGEAAGLHRTQMVFEAPKRENPAGLRYPPPADLKTIKFGRIQRKQGQPKLTVGNLVNAELIQPFNVDNTKGAWAVFDMPTGSNAKNQHCLGVAMWWGASDAEVAEAAKTRGCPAPVAQ